MLVLSRKLGENIYIGDDIEIIVSRIDYTSVRLSISAPRSTPIYRGELYEEVCRLREAFDGPSEPCAE